MLLIQPLSQVSRMEVCDGAVTSLIWPILIQLNANILTLFPRKYSSCCTDLESVAIPALRATFMTSFQKGNISHVDTRVLVVNTFCVTGKRYESSLLCSFGVFFCIFQHPEVYSSACPVTQEGQGCESCGQLTSPGLDTVVNPA